MRFLDQLRHRGREEGPIDEPRGKRALSITKTITSVGAVRFETTPLLIPTIP